MDISQFALYPTGNLCNADQAVQAMASGIKPVIPGKRVAGRALTARIIPGQNAAIHRAVDDARPGDMLVVDGAQSDRFGPFGDLLADCCKARGMAGAVLDCTIRDSADIAKLGFQVFARGYNPSATAKTDPGETNIPVTCGGILVHPGDIVVGDDDGVVVVPQDIAENVMQAVAAVAKKEIEIRSRIMAGESTFEIFDLGRS